MKAATLFAGCVALIATVEGRVLVRPSGRIARASGIGPNSARPSDSANGPFGNKTRTENHSHVVSSTAPLTTGEIDQILDKLNDTIDGHESGGKEYVVLFDPDHPTPPDVVEVLKSVGLHPNDTDVTHVFNNSAFKGFTANMKAHCIDSLNAMSEVKFVEQSIKITSRDTEVRQDAPWGLQRISSQSQVSGDPSKMQFDYTFDTSGDLGKGVDIYVIDTGINTDHLMFNGRARMGFSFNGPNDLNAQADQDGHGTHCSGTAAGDLFGVAPAANLIGVKVLGADGGGSSSDSVKGLDYVIQQHEARKASGDFVASVASMSWGLSARSDAVEQALAAAAGAGIHLAVAAGNENRDACSSSPAALGGSGAPGAPPVAVSVGSIGPDDTISSFSNTGSCVDLYAPGEGVLSTWIGGDNRVNTLSGTSMATPHVTGVIAYLAAKHADLAQDPAKMKAFLVNSAEMGVVGSRSGVLSGDRGLLLNNGFDTTAPASPAAGSSSTEKRMVHVDSSSASPDLRF